MPRTSALKKLLLIIFILTGSRVAISQQLHVIARMVNQSFGAGSTTHQLSMQDVNKADLVNNRQLSTQLNNYSLLQLQTRSLQDMQAAVRAGDPVSLAIPGQKNVSLQLQLVPNAITTADCIVATPSGIKNIDPLMVKKYYTGIINGEPLSLAAISLSEEGIGGMYATGAHNFFVEKLQGASSASKVSIVYSQSDVKSAMLLNCATDEKEFVNAPASLLKPSQVLRPMQGCKTVRVYVEVAYGLFINLGGTIEKATNYVLDLFNITNTIYKNDGINIQLSEIFIWDGPDTYAGVSSYLTHLSVFQNRLLKEKRYGSPIHADIAHSLTTTAYGANATQGSIVNCNNLSVSVCGAMGFPIEPYPVNSYPVMVFAHELGHQLGSPHTQSCTWPGGAIDNCGPTEGICPPGPAPIGGGTIMSYCGNSGVPYGIDLTKGLGPLPSALIRSIIDTSSCLQACSDTVCENKSVTGIKTTLNDSILHLKWDKLAPKYRIGVKPNTTHQWTYFEVTDADSFDLRKTKCEAYFECIISPFCTVGNRYMINDIFPVGDVNALSAAMSTPGSIAGRSFCYGDSVTLTLKPNDISYVYNWTIDGTSQPQFTGASIRTNKTGNYNAVMIANGCTYYSDSFRLSYVIPKANFLVTIDSLAVSFTNNSSCAKQVSWDFGDGSGSSENNPVHNYASKGRYNVTLKIQDANNHKDSITATVILINAIIDTLNRLSSIGSVYGSTFETYACLPSVYFKRDSVTNSIPSIYYGDNGNTQLSKNLVQYPKSGTIELKLFPVSGYRTNDIKQFVQSDTGTIILFNFNAADLFALKFSKWGGVQFNVDTFKIGNIKQMESGPLNLNAWNTIGISFGKQGIHLLVNGFSYAGYDSITIPDNLKYLSYSVGSAIAGGLPANIYYYGFEGALNKIRFSEAEKDWTFSSSASSQGLDTVLVNKTVCYGQLFEGHTSTGVYYTKLLSTTGCDSVVALDLKVADSLQVKDSIDNINAGQQGKISVTVNGGIPPYSYNWNNGATTSAINLSEPGTYHLVVTDSILCRKEFDYTIFAASGSKDIFQVFPNPSKGGTSITLQLSIGNAGNYPLFIYDPTGRLVQKSVLYIKPGINHIPISLLHGSGFYLLRLNRGSEKPLDAKAVVL